MDKYELIATIVTLVSVTSFAAIFTILYYTYTKSTAEQISEGRKDIEIIDEYIYNNQKHVIRRKGIFKMIRTILFYIVLILLIPLFIFSIINKIQGNVTMIHDHAIMVVASGSMSKRNEANDYLDTHSLNNQFNTYDIIMLQKKEDINQYDVIAYKNDKGINVIHRVVKVEEINGELTFTTRGDSNNADDKYHPTMKDVIGVYTNKRIPTIGIFIIFFQSASGFITLFGLCYCLIALDKFNKKIKTAQENRINVIAEFIDLKQDEDSKYFSADYKETIYYKGFAYQFDDKGFVSKNEITESDKLKESNEKMMKVVENNGSSIQEENDFTEPVIEKDLIDEGEK